MSDNWSCRSSTVVYWWGSSQLMQWLQSISLQSLWLQSMWLQCSSTGILGIVVGCGRAWPPVHVGTVWCMLPVLSTCCHMKVTWLPQWGDLLPHKVTWLPHKVPGLVCSRWIGPGHGNLVDLDHGTMDWTTARWIGTQHSCWTGCICWSIAGLGLVMGVPGESDGSNWFCIKHRLTCRL